ncbi:MAG: hypothetical protein ACREX6_04920 [Casimicrobiaceae bacterium]
MPLSIASVSRTATSTAARHAPVEVVYRITETPPAGLTSHALSDGGGILDSRFRLEPIAEGVRLDDDGTLSTRPGLTASLSEDAAAEAAGTQFRALADEMRRVAKSDAIHPVDAASGARG